MRVYFLIGVFVLMLFVVSCESVNVEKIPVEKQCMQDVDCTANTCCHAKESVNRKYAPDCKSVMCTMSCEPKTLDCGQGKVSCVQGECRVVFEKFE